MRNRNVNWNLPLPDLGTWQHVEVALLMDIRDELQTLNKLINCHNFIRIPQVLDSIKKNTAKKRRKKLK